MSRTASRLPGNLVLIGMPGAGKSTIGVVVAKRLSKDFIDTDLLIQRRGRRTLQEILDREGHLRLREIEEAEILRLDAHDAVIATGGSAVYSARAMEHLRERGRIVYLQVEPPVLLARIGDFATRGVAKAPGQTFTELYQERAALYRQYGEMVVVCGTRGHDAIAQEIITRLEPRP